MSQAYAASAQSQTTSSAQSSMSSLSSSSSSSAQSQSSLHMNRASADPMSAYNRIMREHTKRQLDLALDPTAHGPPSLRSEHSVDSVNSSS